MGQESKTSEKRPRRSFTEEFNLERRVREAR
jgi:hypothetical protein